MTLQDALKVNGKAVRKKFNRAIYFMENGVLVYSIDGSITQSSVTFTESQEDSWEPYKEPCKHEPNYRKWNYNPKKPDGYDFGYDDECKHCGVSIKATGWEAV